MLAQQPCTSVFASMVSPYQPCCRLLYGAVVASEVWETSIFLSLVAVSETDHLHGVHLLHLRFLCPGFDLLHPGLFHPVRLFHPAK